ncbi:hypothetical protein TUM4445_07820 [Shewanella sp. MBTL60-112-B2]|nr:hypothetical protein TUM4444_36150 [Shewanella sp. MBTL60-112-B1]GIU27537.1 hypothetical protein TUM4445_07820 [Shewanella sp. MBTL60-112-B2]
MKLRLSQYIKSLIFNIFTQRESVHIVRLAILYLVQSMLEIFQKNAKKDVESQDGTKKGQPKGLPD